VDGIYGEVKSIDSRAVRIVTADDTEVNRAAFEALVHPRLQRDHAQQSLLCVGDFYLHPDHDAAVAHSGLTEVAVAVPIGSRHSGDRDRARETLGHALIG